jgi:hypothetical protein
VLDQHGVVNPVAGHLVKQALNRFVLRRTRVDVRVNHRRLRGIGHHEALSLSLGAQARPDDTHQNP